MKNKKLKSVAVLIVFVLLLGLCSYTAVEGFGEEKAGSASSIHLGLDLAGGVSITYQVVGEEKPSGADMSDTIYKLQQRVYNYSTEAQVYQEGDDRINIEIPGVSDANAILEELGKPGSLYFIRQRDSEGNENYSYTMAANEATGEVEYSYVLNKPIEEIVADGSVALNGTDVKNAQAGARTDQMSNDYVVQLDLTDEGTVKFAEATQAAFNAGETIGIYYDGKVVSAPRVSAVITNGTAEINGMGSFERAEQLASTIRIGGLKLELEELHSKVVGAQLGSEAIDTSLKAGAIGLAIVILFMIVVYLLPGFAASLALLLYVAITVVLLYGFDITLTLPGIAGIILSIGMAVDANVIIFARIREELATGKTISSAMKTGFDKALSAIIDGNVTTLIAAAVLAIIGSGSVKGFAYTLALGIVISLFTSLVVTRILLNAFYNLGCKSPKLFGVAKEHKTISFLSGRKIFFTVSAACVLAGFVIMGVQAAAGNDALNFSLEFKGGTSTNVTFNENMTIEDIDANIVPLIEKITGDGNVQTQKVEGSNEVIFKTRSLDVSERDALVDVLVTNYSVDESKITAENISSTISSEMRAESLLAVAVAAVCMLIYIWLRFKDIRFGASSVIALVHDVLVVLTFYAAVRLSVSSTFIACMLTIVGYSVNATIVIFDRIRENMAAMGKKDDLEEMVNRSITQTLSRSVFTSLTTFIMVAVLWVMGVSSIREFALPLMVGIACGTYSSVCVTGALWYVFKTKFVKKQSEK